MKKKQIVVLGAGMVGAVMALDLASEKDFHVTVVDRDEKTLAALREKGPIETRKADLAEVSTVQAVVAPADLVIGAVPGFLGFQTLRAVIEAGKNIADISFMPEDFFELDGLARAKQVTAVVDCGVAPGLSNLILGKHAAEFEMFETAEILVGGLPRIRTWPYAYKAPFSPIDVIEEYVRPARYIRDGRVVTMPALSEPEMVDLPGVCTLESFNTDGLRSLLTTVKCPNMKEKTLRYPGHIEIMRVLRESGFLKVEPIVVGGMKIVPREFTTALLFASWKLNPGEEEFTVLRVQVVGLEKGERIRYTYDLLDYNDPRTGFSSMSRTTGFPNVLMARQILSGNFSDHGVFPPEKFGGRCGIFSAMIAGLKARGVHLAILKETLP